MTSDMRCSVALRPADVVAIEAVIQRWDAGWVAFDAALASQDYADDADWTNAFGIYRKGRAEIHSYLHHIYQTPQLVFRKSTPSVSSIRFISHEVAVVISYRETVGQKTLSGAEYPTRKTRDSRVLLLVKGKWEVVSHLVADQKEALL